MDMRTSTITVSTPHQEPVIVLFNDTLFDGKQLKTLISLLVSFVCHEEKQGLLVAFVKQWVFQLLRSSNGGLQGQACFTSCTKLQEGNQRLSWNALTDHGMLS